MREREIARAKTIEIAEQDKAIAIAEKTKVQSEAQAQADVARALAVKAEEQVATARATEIAERQKAIELVEAAQQAEREAIGITVAAASRQKGQRRPRSGPAQSSRKAMPTPKSCAPTPRAPATPSKPKAKLRSTKPKTVCPPKSIALQIKQALIAALPDIIRESVKPMENIEGIKILQVNGLGGSNGGTNGGANGAASSGNLAEDMVNSALRYRAQAPLIDSLLRELGVNGGEMGDMIQGAAQAAEVKPEPHFLPPDGKIQPIAPVFVPPKHEI